MNLMAECFNIALILLSHLLLGTPIGPSAAEQKTGLVGGGWEDRRYTRVGTLIVATIYLQLIQNIYMFRSFTVLQCSHQHCVQPVASDVEVVGYL